MIFTTWLAYLSLQEAREANRQSRLSYIGTFRDDCRAEEETWGAMSAACTEVLRKPLPRPTWIDDVLDKRSAILLANDLAPVPHDIWLAPVSRTIPVIVALSALLTYLYLDHWEQPAIKRSWFEAWVSTVVSIIKLSVAPIYLVLDCWEQPVTTRMWVQALMSMEAHFVTPLLTVVTMLLFYCGYSYHRPPQTIGLCDMVANIHMILLPVMGPRTRLMQFEAQVIAMVPIIITLSTAVFQLAPYHWKQSVTRRIRAIKTLCTDQPKRGRMVFGEFSTVEQLETALVG